MRDRLIELLTKTFDEQYEKRMLITPQHTADYLLANGVVCPPCKVGDVVYATALNTKTGIVAIHRGYIGSIDIRSSDNYIFICHEGFDDEPYFNNICGKFSDFGKTIFLTREEAERALKGEKVLCL